MNAAGGAGAAVAPALASGDSLDREIARDVKAGSILEEWDARGVAAAAKLERQQSRGGGQKVNELARASGKVKLGRALDKIRAVNFWRSLVSPARTAAGVRPSAIPEDAPPRGVASSPPHYEHQGSLTARNSSVGSILSRVLAPDGSLTARSSALELTSVGDLSLTERDAGVRGRRLEPGASGDGVTGGGVGSFGGVDRQRAMPPRVSEGASTARAGGGGAPPDPAAARPLGGSMTSRGDAAIVGRGGREDRLPAVLRKGGPPTLDQRRERKLGELRRAAAAQVERDLAETPRAGGTGAASALGPTPEVATPVGGDKEDVVASSRPPVQTLPTALGAALVASPRHSTSADGGAAVMVTPRRDLSPGARLWSIARSKIKAVLAFSGLLALNAVMLPGDAEGALDSQGGDAAMEHTANKARAIASLIRMRAGVARWRARSGAHAVSKLTPFMPRMLMQLIMSSAEDGTRRERRPYTAAFVGAMMVADISGFTPLTERLSKNGSDGVELLTRCMNAYFTLVMNLVGRYGGDIIKFAGDSMLIVFKAGDDDKADDDGGLAACAVRAASCAADVLHSYGTMRILHSGEVEPVSREETRAMEHGAKARKRWGVASTVAALGAIAGGSSKPGSVASTFVLRPGAAVSQHPPSRAPSQRHDTGSPSSKAVGGHSSVDTAWGDHGDPAHHHHRSLSGEHAASFSHSLTASGPTSGATSYMPSDWEGEEETPSRDGSGGDVSGGDVDGGDVDTLHDSDRSSHRGHRPPGLLSRLLSCGGAGGEHHHQHHSGGAGGHHCSRRHHHHHHRPGWACVPCLHRSSSHIHPGHHDGDHEDDDDAGVAPPTTKPRRLGYPSMAATSAPGVATAITGYDSAFATSATSDAALATPSGGGVSNADGPPKRSVSMARRGSGAGSQPPQSSSSPRRPPTYLRKASRGGRAAALAAAEAAALGDALPPGEPLLPRGDHGDDDDDDNAGGGVYHGLSPGEMTGDVDASGLKSSVERLLVSTAAAAASGSTLSPPPPSMASSAAVTQRVAGAGGRSNRGVTPAASAIAEALASLGDDDGEGESMLSVRALPGPVTEAYGGAVGDEPPPPDRPASSSSLGQEAVNGSGMTPEPPMSPQTASNASRRRRRHSVAAGDPSAGGSAILSWGDTTTGGVGGDEPGVTSTPAAPRHGVLSHKSEGLSLRPRRASLGVTSPSLAGLTLEVTTPGVHARFGAEPSPDKSEGRSLKGGSVRGLGGTMGGSRALSGGRSTSLYSLADAVPPSPHGAHASGFARSPSLKRDGPGLGNASMPLFERTGSNRALGGPQTLEPTGSTKHHGDGGAGGGGAVGGAPGAPADGGPPMMLSLKVTIGGGRMHEFILGGEAEKSTGMQRWEYLVCDEPGAPAPKPGEPMQAIAQIAVAEKDAASGDVILSSELGSLPAVAERCALTKLASGHYRLAGFSLDGGGPIVPAASPPPPVQIERLTQMVQGRATQLVRMHVLDNVRQRIEAGHQDFVNEIRVCTCVFLGIPSLAEPMAAAADGGPAPAGGTSQMDRMQAVMRAVQRRLAASEGSLLQFRMDEKGFLMIGAFGLPGKTHDDDAIRGLRAALAIVQSLSDLKQVGRVGVTTGQLFCACVGSALRTEYTVFGDTINLAARLMCKAPRGQVYCDATTWGIARRRFRFEELEPMQLKGKAYPTQVYRAQAPLQMREKVAALLRQSSRRGAGSFNAGTAGAGAGATADGSGGNGLSGGAQSLGGDPLHPGSFSRQNGGSAAPKVSTWEVMGQQTVNPLAGPDGVGEEPLVGRDAQLTQLKRALVRCVESKAGGLVMLHGEAGMGKSSLIAEFERDIAAHWGAPVPSSDPGVRTDTPPGGPPRRRVRMYTARALKSETAQPLHGWRTILRDVFACDREHVFAADRDRISAAASAASSTAVAAGVAALAGLNDGSLHDSVVSRRVSSVSSHPSQLALATTATAAAPPPSHLPSYDASLMLPGDPPLPPILPVVSRLVSGAFNPWRALVAHALDIPEPEVPMGPALLPVGLMGRGVGTASVGGALGGVGTAGRALHSTTSSFSVLRLADGSSAAGGVGEPLVLGGALGGSGRPLAAGPLQRLMTGGSLANLGTGMGASLAQSSAPLALAAPPLARVGSGATGLGKAPPRLLASGDSIIDAAVFAALNATSPVAQVAPPPAPVAPGDRPLSPGEVVMSPLVAVPTSGVLGLNLGLSATGVTPQSCRQSTLLDGDASRSGGALAVHPESEEESHDAETHAESHDTLTELRPRVLRRSLSTESGGVSAGAHVVGGVTSAGVYGGMTRHLTAAEAAAALAGRASPSLPTRSVSQPHLRVAPHMGLTAGDVATLTRSYTTAGPGAEASAGLALGTVTGGVTGAVTGRSVPGGAAAAAARKLLRPSASAGAIQEDESTPVASGAHHHPVYAAVAPAPLDDGPVGNLLAAPDVDALLLAGVDMPPMFTAGVTPVAPFPTPPSPPPPPPPQPPLPVPAPVVSATATTVVATPSVTLGPTPPLTRQSSSKLGSKESSVASGVVSAVGDVALPATSAGRKSGGGALRRTKSASRNNTADLSTRVAGGPAGWGQLVMSPEMRQKKVQSWLATILAAASTREPMVVIVEDAQYLDSGSAELAKAISHSCKHLLLVLTYRHLTPAEAAGNPVLADVLRELMTAESTEVVTCGPLDVEQTGELLRGALALGRTVDQEVIEDVWEKTQGLPLYLSQIIAALKQHQAQAAVDSTALSLSANSWLGKYTLKGSSIQQVITNRIDRLRPSQQLTLKVASVIGTSFSKQLLTLINPMGHDTPGALDADLVELQELNFVAKDDHDGRLYHFATTLVRDVAYELIPFAQRRLLHGTLAEAFAAQLASPPGEGGPSLDAILSHAATAERGLSTQSSSFKLRASMRGSFHLRSSTSSTAIAHHATLACAGNEEDNPDMARLAVFHWAIAGGEAVERDAHEEVLRLYKRACAVDDAMYDKGLDSGVAPSVRATWECHLGTASMRLGGLEAAARHLLTALDRLGVPLPREMGRAVFRSRASWEARRLLPACCGGGVAETDPALPAPLVPAARGLSEVAVLSEDGPLAAYCRDLCLLLSGGARVAVPSLRDCHSNCCAVVAAAREAARPERPAVMKILLSPWTMCWPGRQPDGDDEDGGGDDKGDDGHGATGDHAEPAIVPASTASANAEVSRI